MTSWLDTPLEGRELLEYAVSRIPADWELRGTTVVGRTQGGGERKQVVVSNVMPRRQRGQRT